MVTETIGEVDPEQDESGFLTAIAPELVVPIVTYLASRDLSRSPTTTTPPCAGRFARAFVGLGEGWLAPAGSGPTAEDIDAHWAEISATDPYIVPTSIFDEVAEICRRLGIGI